MRAGESDSGGRATIAIISSPEEGTAHNLRHTYVREAHEAGETAGVIMAMTGHVHEPTVLHYLRVSARAQQRSQERLEAHRREQAEKVKASNVVRLRSQRAAGV